MAKGKATAALGDQNASPGIDEPVADLANAQPRHATQPPLFVFSRIRVRGVVQEPGLEEVSDHLWQLSPPARHAWRRVGVERVGMVAGRRVFHSCWPSLIAIEARRVSIVLSMGSIATTIGTKRGRRFRHIIWVRRARALNQVPVLVRRASISVLCSLCAVPSPLLSPGRMTVKVL